MAGGRKPTRLRWDGRWVIARNTATIRPGMRWNWAKLHFGEVKVATEGGQHIFEVQVYLNGLEPDAVRVELYADGVNGGSPVRREMTRVRQLVGAANGYLYSACVPASRPTGDYTPRLLPRHPQAAIPLEAAHILWQR